MSHTAAGSSSTPPGSPTSATAPASPATTSLSPSASALAPLPTQSGALTTAAGTAGAATTGGALTSNANSDLANTYNNTNGYNSMGYGGMGMGMDPYGMGYGGMGMGYGGLGMGMGYGGLGMMGMGGMGMMGMGMYGMTPEAQRAQMMMMMTNSIMQLWGMFSQVMQMTLGSAVQFVGEYVGINQRLGQIEEEHLNLEERYQNRKYDLRKALADIPKEQRYVPKPPRVRKQKQPSFFRRFVVRLLRHVVFFVVAYVLARKVASWAMARSGKKLLETSTSKALLASSKLN
ncbi:hypothetical protein ABL78_7987 [Leptomonas seymouri]|uniref:Peroxin-13 n=1 Tax=Leptomonas seymouri TaxID=5684 RepID=A0A0N0P2X3_LEPSE|nr:hypothetical protein ABL78_7987 [Leptomonas seymouri]|eukprot:KPI82997.1 hypothetical protein ABL78_7987 [Leptomonas seymouri]